MDKKQILIIHGGNTFAKQSDYIDYLKNTEIDKSRLYSTIDWKQTISDRLGDNYEVLNPRMPNASYARYDEWKLYFEALTKVLDNNVILIGHSLGGIFLAKYLSENKFPKKIDALFLLAAPFEKKGNTLGDFKLSDNFSKLNKQVKKIYILHSEDDPVVPISDSDKYISALPLAELVIFHDKGHFNTEEFSGLVYLIKDL
jgi:predicted alpha/beta hydrolase family esterase